VPRNLLTRRELLRTAGAAGLAAVAAACTRTYASSDLVDWNQWWARRRQTGSVDFANWPYYIDRTRKSTHPSLELFTARTDIRVNYYRPINDNAAFLRSITPDLEAGRPTGYDIVVITNGPELSTLIERDWLVPLDHSRLPTFAANASPAVRDPYWDPQNRYSVTWQSGLTGIAYRPEAAKALGHEPTSLRDLWSPALRGRVGMLTDLMDLGAAALLAEGTDPATSTDVDWRRAAATLRTQRDAGTVRKYYDQGYVRALERGDIWLSQAWSGDIYQANRLGHPELRFVVPTEGVVFWTDNMLIPRGAQHPVDALELMDFVYEPRPAAMIADWVWYISPVPAAREVVADRLDDPKVARSDLVFPSADLIGGSSDSAVTLGGGSPLRYYPRLATAPERAAWSGIFGPIVDGA
jgi:spermidine/putrescine transport system substrate-binding protein